MPIHSRPHLTTHNRNQGHSAVAAAAYRLGLRLRDHRTDIWHDYTKRAAGEEVVAAFTLAPEGAPAWATDPHELWNRVEECERRKDAQLARDYVVPIPLGLSDTQAQELARRLARYISTQLSTAVSIGVHRDADTNVFGEIKPAEQQGYHAHLLFPTRPLILEGDEGVGDGEVVSLGFGPKLSALSNRRTSSGIVELMNREWADLANEFTAAAGLVADYDHRSYERLGIDKKPMPRLTRNAVAMEKKGFFTRQGDAAREIVVLSKVYEQAHAAALEAQHAQAVADANAPQPAPTTPSARPTTSPKVDEAAANGPGHDAHGLKEDLAAARDRGLATDAAWADRFITHSPAPKDDEGRQKLFTLSGLVWAIQRSLKVIGDVTAKILSHREHIGRLRSARLGDQFKMDEARRDRQSAEGQIEAWAKAHPWRMRTSRGRPQALRGLDRVVDLQHRVIRDLKAANQISEGELVRWRAEEAQLVELQEKAHAKLASSVNDFCTMDLDAVPALLAALPEGPRSQIELLLPLPKKMPVAATAQAETPVAPPTLKPEKPRPRMAP